MAAIGPELLEAALDIISREGGGPVSWWVFEPTSVHEDLAAMVGLSGGTGLEYHLGLYADRLTWTVLAIACLGSMPVIPWLEEYTQSLARPSTPLSRGAGGAGAGLAGMVEVAAVHGKANASLAVGYGYAYARRVGVN